LNDNIEITSCNVLSLKGNNVVIIDKLNKFDQMKNHSIDIIDITKPNLFYINITKS
jgi:hypothetical protein